MSVISHVRLECKRTLLTITANVVYSNFRMITILLLLQPLQDTTRLNYYSPHDSQK